MTLLTGWTTSEVFQVLISRQTLQDLVVERRPRVLRRKRDCTPASLPNILEMALYLVSGDFGGGRIGTSPFLLATPVSTSEEEGQAFLLALSVSTSCT